VHGTLPPLPTNPNQRASQPIFAGCRDYTVYTWCNRCFREMITPCIHKSDLRPAAPAGQNQAGASPKRWTALVAAPSIPHGAATAGWPWPAPPRSQAGPACSRSMAEKRTPGPLHGCRDNRKVAHLILESDPPRRLMRRPRACSRPCLEVARRR